MFVGYARVSTDGQTLDAQQAALREADAGQIFAEKISGAVTERKALARAIGALAPGDTLIVSKLDRLARSTPDLLNCWMLSPKLAQRSSRSVILGAILQVRTVS
jgi:DNA invertase Pin-like site-specific DNA recombinase